MAAREVAVKKYVVKLSAAEREQLETMVSGGKHPEERLTKARILLKADSGEVAQLSQKAKFRRYRQPRLPVRRDGSTDTGGPRF